MTPQKPSAIDDLNTALAALSTKLQANVFAVSATYPDGSRTWAVQAGSLALGEDVRVLAVDRSARRLTTTVEALAAFSPDVPRGTQLETADESAYPPSPAAWRPDATTDPPPAAS